MRSYEYRHVVTLEDTNAIGNVYYVNHLRWQGRCRELFLRDHVPELVGRLGRDLCLVTTRCSCEYFAELSPQDEVVMRMTLGEVSQNRVTMCFEYHRAGNGAPEELVARGEQQVAAMQRRDGKLVPAPLPSELHAALAPYRR